MFWTATKETFIRLTIFTLCLFRVDTMVSMRRTLLALLTVTASGLVSARKSWFCGQPFPEKTKLQRRLFVCHPFFVCVCVEHTKNVFGEPSLLFVRILAFSLGKRQFCVPFSVGWMCLSLVHRPSWATRALLCELNEVFLQYLPQEALPNAIKYLGGALCL